MSLVRRCAWRQRIGTVGSLRFSGGFDGDSVLWLRGLRRWISAPPPVGFCGCSFEYACLTGAVLRWWINGRSFVEFGGGTFEDICQCQIGLRRRINLRAPVEFGHGPDGGCLARHTGLC